ncbi:MAG: nucleotide sugar dehydrogenase [Pseudonocardiaceae bacterium]|nr:nucleotide sugar dehydrogenase [Pseudonocardiaceae bacterium]
MLPGSDKRRKVAVLGLGYVGLPLAVAMCEAGHRVAGFDVDAGRLCDIVAGRTGLVDLDHDALARALKRGDLVVTGEPGDLAACEVYLVCVPTPLRDGVPNLSMVLAAVDTVAETLAPGDLVVLESTTWPGTTEEVVAPRLRERTALVAGTDVRLVFSPERIDPGNREYPLARIPKLVGGVTRADGEFAAEFYGTFIDTVHLVSGAAEAELAKILENTFRHVNLALVNELATMYSGTSIDLREAIDAAATKPFGFLPFHPGPGVGGHCIPVDPMYLTRQTRRSGRCLRLVETAELINIGMSTHVVDRVTGLLNSVRMPVRGSRIVLLGAGYKPDVADSRESSAFPIMDRLHQLGAYIRWHDPLLGSVDKGPPGSRVADLDRSLLASADLVLLHTPHAEYVGSELLPAARLTLDAHGALRSRRLPNVHGL